MRRWWRGWGADETGSATIEAVLWMPIFVLCLGLMTDATMIFHGYTQALRVLQDGNRALAIGRFEAPHEAEAWIERTLGPMSAGARAATSTEAGIITTTVTLPASELQVLGIFAGFNGLTLTLRAQHVMEL